jgi:cytochrome c oxidase assembly protein subunit 15
MLGVIMLVIQIMLGGITRLTESGLSITEWNPVTGALPPMNEKDWIREFAKYKNTDQFRYIHADFTLSDFKTIYFWEWLHRNWARLMGLVFIIGFIYFLIKKQLKEDTIIPFIILFLLGMLQGLIGWLMVKSGLVPEQLFVGHIQLATHFMAALLLLCYTLWFALNLSTTSSSKIANPPLRNLTILCFAVLILQLIYGAFMAGLHAAQAAPTWPSINGEWWPEAMNKLKPAWKNIFHNKITIQFIHRAFAYLLTIIVTGWTYLAFKSTGNDLFRKTRVFPIILIVAQVVLGVCAVITSPFGNNLVWFGVAHQLTAILFLMTMVFMLYIIRRNSSPYP